MAQVAAVYLVVAWLTMQVVDVIAVPLRLPEWFPTVVIVFLAIGFPIALIISWAFNVTPAGVVRETDTVRSSSGRVIEYVLMGLVGIAVVWLLYRTEFGQAPSPSEAQPVAEVAAPDVLPNSIAVLPFANLSPDPDNAYFAAGIHDSILNELAKIRDMHVISRTTMVRYTDTEKSMSEIADELRVETVMEGSIQYANGRVLVTAQLIDAQTDAHLWSDNYNEDFSDIFAIQADIATRIAEKLQAQVSPQEQQSIQAQMTSSPEAYTYYLQAITLGGLDISPADDIPEFHALLDKAIDADPNFARAYAMKARLYAGRRDGDSLASEYGQKALELDPDLGLAHYALAVNHMSRMRDDQARQGFEIALSLSPNDMIIIDDAARYYVTVGDLDLAIRLASKLHDNDPGISGVLSHVTLMAGDIDASLQAIRQTVEANPDRPFVHSIRAVIEKLAGNQDMAREEAELAARLGASYNDYQIIAGTSSAYRFKVAGVQEQADRVFDRVVERSESGHMFNSRNWTFAYAAIGDYKKALEYLQLLAQEVEEGYRAGSNSYLAYNVYRDPMFETPEFIEVRKRLGYDLSDIL